MEGLSVHRQPVSHAADEGYFRMCLMHFKLQRQARWMRTIVGVLTCNIFPMCRLDAQVHSGRISAIDRCFEYAQPSACSIRQVGKDTGGFISRAVVHGYDLEATLKILPQHTLDALFNQRSCIVDRYDDRDIH